MIIHVTMLGPAWHARPDPGEPGRVSRRSYSDGHLASGTVTRATDSADGLLLRNCAIYFGSPQPISNRSLEEYGTDE